MSIDLTRDGTIATITINNPERLNALNPELLMAMHETVTAVSRDRQVRVIVLTGAGDRAFVAGADIKAMAGYSVDEGLAFARLGHAVAAALELAPQPVIAAINGFALGGGCELALACDIRIASTIAVFAQPEVSLGIPPGWGGSQRLPKVVGPALAAELIYSGRRVKADEALQIGLVNRVCGPEELMPTALELAGQIAANSPHAVRASKRLIARSYAGHPSGGLAEEAHAFSEVFGSANQREGMGAFIEKRKPVFED